MRIVAFPSIFLVFISPVFAQETNSSTIANCVFDKLYPSDGTDNQRLVTFFMASGEDLIWRENGKDYKGIFISSSISHGGQNSIVAYRDSSFTDTLVFQGTCMARDCYSAAFNIDGGFVASLTTQTIGYGEFIISVFTGTCLFAEEIQ